MPETQFTLTQISNLIGATIYQTRYYIKALNIQPCQRVSQIRLFTQKDADRIKVYVDRIKATKAGREAKE